MDIAALNTPATPPYEFHNHSVQPVETASTQNVNKVYTTDPYFDRPIFSADYANAEPTTSPLSDGTDTSQSSFRRVSLMSMPSPPELLTGACEDGDINTSSPSSVSSLSLSDDDTIHKKRKSTPYRSPANLGTDFRSVIFQLERNSSPTILNGRTITNLAHDQSLLWSLRQRVISANQSRHSSTVTQKRSNLINPRNNRLSAPRTEKRVLKPMKVRIPKPQWLKDIMTEEIEDEEDEAAEGLAAQHQSSYTGSPLNSVTSYNDPVDNTSPLFTIPNLSQTNSISSWQHDPYNGTSNFKTIEVNHLHQLQTCPHQLHATATSNITPAPLSSASVPRRKSSNHGSSGRPTRVKGPCQACHETSDGCMRKAFYWPFPTSTTYNDKGKPFVYLCNKCGLRYNKSGGCVCRHCRWVLCKEEKRKAMELIDLMRRSRPDGRVDSEENIENFVCTPKYWNCGHPWKVSWVLNAQHDDDDNEEDDTHYRSLNSTSTSTTNASSAVPAVASAFFASSN